MHLFFFLQRLVDEYFLFIRIIWDDKTATFTFSLENLELADPWARLHRQPIILEVVLI